ncbi:FHA domain-containing protein FHA2-like [Canna indica]|uniref:FHA domain-containing protein FHA2-like n=1 Tax=Canna indica TaxID=4628 RepID=A0AAQ3QKG6_9LILI|nr:FHA domain-containing protein FHA2-like [Canna indica]
MAKGRNGGAGRRGGGDHEETEVGFAKLQGEDFEYYMQTYSIVLGRNSKTSAVDVDLASIGGGMNISRRHARIFYDFPRRRFALEVLGKNGCLVEGVLHEPGSPPVKLDSQDLLQIGDKQFYFLLPSRSVFDAGPVARHPAAALPPGRATPRDYANGVQDDADDDRGEQEEQAEEEEDEAMSAATAKLGKRERRDLIHEDETASLGNSVKKPERRSRADKEADDQLLLQLEEKDVISSVATVLTNLCGPGERLPMEELHAKLFKIHGDVWHHSRVRRYLTSEDCPESETKGRPWYGLLMLLKKYPEYFVIHIQSKGRVTSELVQLVSSPS